MCLGQHKVLDPVRPHSVRSATIPARCRGPKQGWYTPLVCPPRADAFVDPIISKICELVELCRIEVSSTERTALVKLREC